MQERLGIIPVPKWLQNKEFAFNVKEVLQDSLYYPYSSFYGEPVRLFRGNVNSFVFVDYGCSNRAQLIVELEHHGFVGFKPIHNEAILISQLIPHGWRPRIQPNNNQGRRPPNIEPFCEWMIFENDQRERFSLLYLSADAVASYSALYQSNNVKPKIVAMIPPPRELVVPWTDITNENEIFARTLLDVPSSIPRYIVLNRKQWSNFPIEICSLDANIELKVWGRK